MNLVFSYVHPTQSSHTLGPFGSIQLSIDGMRGRADGPLLAAYKEHQWLVHEQSYFRLDCTTRVSVRFIRESEPSRRYGPFQRFSAVNGLAYGDDHVIAFLDYKKNEWLYYDTGHHWPVMEVTDVGGNQ